MEYPRLDQPLYVAKADLFRSLGHPVRIRILELLVNGELPVSRLLSELGIEPSTLSQHLSVLKQTGLVVSQRQGNTVSYQITDPSIPKFLAAARSVLASTLGRAQATLERLDQPK